MKNVILVRGARQLLTLRGPAGPRRGAALGDLGLIQDGSVLIQDGRILDVGPTRRIENLAKARDADEIDATGHVVMPGFVDSHTHLVSGPPQLDDYETRSSGNNARQMGVADNCSLSSLQAVRTTSSRTLMRRSRALLDAFIRHGTTTLEAKSGYGLDRGGEMKTLRVLRTLNGAPLDVVPTYFGARAIPPEFDGRPDEYIDWMCTTMMPEIRRRRLAPFVDISCERNAFRLEDARRYLEAAHGMGFSLKVHTEQFSHSGGARLAVEVGATSADHLEHVGPDDIAILAQSSTIATLLPGWLFHLGLQRYPPARALIDHGVAVALATDLNPATSPTCNMQMILSLACTQMRMTPAEAISAATINGAHALNCADRVGSLEIGKQADLIALDVPDYREIPYDFGMNRVYMTIKKGSILYRQAEVQWPEN
jgi:imidazolonepropionase